MPGDVREAHAVPDGDGMLDTIEEEVTEFVFSVPDFGPGDALSVPAPDGTRLKLRLPQNALPGDRMYMGKNDTGDWVIKRVARSQSKERSASKPQVNAGSGSPGYPEALQTSPTPSPVLPAEIYRSPNEVLRIPEHGSSTPPAKEDRVDPDCVTIMCLGDSYTHGWHIPGGYRIHLWELMQQARWKVRFAGSFKNGPKTIDRRHEGWPGYRIEELISGRGEEVDINLQRDLSRHKPDIVLLLVGTNDVVQDLDLQSAGHRFVTLLDMIQSQLPTVKVIFGNLPNLRGMEAGVELVNEQLVEGEKAANACGLWTRLLDINSLLGPRDFHDSVHLNIRGFNKLARAFFKVLEEVIPVEARPAARPEQPSYAKQRSRGIGEDVEDPVAAAAKRKSSPVPSSREANGRRPDRKSPGGTSPRTSGRSLSPISAKRAPSPVQSNSWVPGTTGRNGPPSAGMASPRSQPRAVSSTSRPDGAPSASVNPNDDKGHYNVVPASMGPTEPASATLKPPAVPHNLDWPGLSRVSGQSKAPTSTETALISKETAKDWDHEFRDDILRRVQQNQQNNLRLGAAPLSARNNGLNGKADELVVDWDAPLEEGELACTIS